MGLIQNPPVRHLPAPQKKPYIYKKTQNRLLPLLPMAESLVSHGFHGNKTHILTLLPFVTASVFWM